MNNVSLNEREKAISKLVDLTQDGNIKWKVVDSTKYLPNEDTNGVMLFTQFMDQFLLLYRKAYLRIIGDIYPSFSGSPTNKIDKDYHPELSTYDPDTKTIIYTFPDSELIFDLYKAATYYASNIDDFITRILREK